MADPKDPKDPKDPADPKDPKDPKDPADPKDGGLEATVRRVVSELIPKLRPGSSEHDVTAQVEAAVTKVHRGQQAQQVIDDLTARLKAVEDKKIPEKAPKQYRRITKLLWGSDDD